MLILKCFKSRKIIITFCFTTLLLMLANTFVEADSWPFKPTNVQHRIRQTIGAYRVGDRFHDGVDIVPNEGADDMVYPVVSDYSGWAFDKGTKKEGIRVGRRAYIHIRVLEKAKDTFVTAGVTELGRLIDLEDPEMSNHLHFIEGPVGGPMNNPLDSLEPFKDTAKPKVYKIRIYKDMEAKDDLAQKKENISGPVYLKASIYDRMSHGVSDHRGHVAPYEIGYAVYKKNGSAIKPFEPTIKFDKCPPKGSDAKVIYPPDGRRSEYPRYWVTNKATEGNTPKAESWSAPDFTEDAYIIKVVAKDSKGNTAQEFLPYKVQIIAIDNSFSMTKGWWKKPPDPNRLETSKEAALSFYLLPNS